MYDVVIVGGGPAGLSAALVLGRCRRRVLVCDAGTPRNQRSRGLHGYLTRDGVLPLELLRLGRDELDDYDVEIRRTTVTDVVPIPGGFQVTASDGVVRGRTLLLATGVRDHVPDIPGLDECYGTSVHHCPYCDGWEHGNKTIAVLGDRTSPAGLALSLRTWTDKVIALTNGGPRVGNHQRERLAEQGIPLRETPIDRINHIGGRITGVRFAGGDTLECDALFFTAPQEQQSELARRLGCEFNRKNTVKTNRLGETCVPGIYVAGDASRDVQFVIVAAAEGAKAGVAINKALQAAAGLTVPAVPGGQG